MVTSFTSEKQDLCCGRKSVQRFKGIFSSSMNCACSHELIYIFKRKLDQILLIDENCFPHEKLTCEHLKGNSENFLLWNLHASNIYCVEYICDQHTV